MATIHDIICAINPKLYLKTSDDKGKAKKELSDFIELLKKEGIQKAAEKAKPKPLEQHTLVYDSSTEGLEPVYFFILDLMNDFHLDPEKMIDNFTASPGSGHFGDLGQRISIMQQQASRLMGDINTVTRSILNIVYDLKEFKIRLQSYTDLKSSDPSKKESALLSLKQIWMDRVDVNKGNSSMKAMAFSGGGQIGMQTLIDAFLFVKDQSLKGPDGKEIDLNERVKRVLRQRIYEFNIWVAESERELTKRYELERKYLKSQVNSVKLYSRWAKPYLQAAQKLEMSDHSKNPDMVNTFNSTLLELTILGKSKLDVVSAAAEELLPKKFKVRKVDQDYYSCIVVDFYFREIPNKISPYQTNYSFGGRAEVTFSAYALTDEELTKARKEFEDSSMGDALKLIEGATTSSLDEMQKDIDMFLNEEDEEEKKEEKKKSRDTSNPFVAIIGGYDEKKDKSSNKPSGSILNRNRYWEEIYLRPLASNNAKEAVFSLFDIYKKAHGMPSYT